MKRLLTLLLAGTILTGCQNTEEQLAESQAEETAAVDEAAEAQAQITVSVDGEERADEEVLFEEGSTLLEVMDENFDIETNSADFGEFMVSIEGHEQNEAEGRYWMYDINGEMAPVGMGEYTVENGDLIEWSLEGTQAE